MTFPKIELHVHLEGTVRAATLLQIARRNGVSLPADSVEGLAGLYEFRDFSHFIKVWELTTCALRTAEDFRQVGLGRAERFFGKVLAFSRAKTTISIFTNLRIRLHYK